MAVALACIPVAVHAQTTCAVIASPAHGLEEAAFLDQVDAQLARNSELVLLSRSEIKRIMTERAISLTVTSDRASRRNTGAFLRADLLVLLEAQVTSEGRVVALHVVETRHGLVLSDDKIVWDDRAVRMADLISRRITQAARRAREPVSAVVAVPPFASGDFTFDFTHLKHAYARLVTQAVLRIPGTIVVDLGRAREVAKELAISRGEPRVERALPWYIIGEYHNHERGDARTVDVRLVLRLGDRVMAAEKRTGLGPASVRSFLQETVMKMLTEQIGRSPSLGNGSGQILEADMLEEHSRAARMLGHWEDAVRLAEAALLLDPDRTLLHFDIFAACEHLVDRSGMKHALRIQPVSLTPQEKEAARRWRRHALLGLEHLAHYLRSHTYGDVEQRAMGGYWDKCTLPAYASWTKDVYGIRDLQREVCLAKVDNVLYILRNNRLLIDQRNEGSRERLLALARTAARCVAEKEHWQGGRGEEALFTAKEFLDLVRRLVVAFGRHAEGFDGQCMLIQRTFSYATEHPQDFADLLAELRRVQEGPTSVLADFAELIVATQQDHARRSKGWYDYFLLPQEKKELVRRVNALIATAYPHREATAGDLPGIRLMLRRKFGIQLPEMSSRPNNGLRRFGKVTFTPIAPLMPPDGRPFAHEALLFHGGWLACGEGCDVIWGNEKAVYQNGNHGELIEGYEQRRPLCVYVMNEPGKLMPVPRADKKPWKDIVDVKWDGRFVWVACRGEDYGLHVIDPSTVRIVATFSAADGLPPASRGLRIAPLGPGEICAVGCFGRTWIANLSLEADPEHGTHKQVDIFHQARKFYQEGWPDQKLRSDVGLAFDPVFAVTLSNPGLRHPRVVVHRSLMVNATHAGRYRFDLILVDPHERSVQPFPHDWPRGTVPLVVGGRLLTLDSPVCALDPSQSEPDELVRLQAEAPHWRPIESAVSYDGLVHCINHEWFTLDPHKRRLLRSRVRLPEDVYEPDIYLPGPRLAVSSHFGVVLYSWQRGIFRASFPDGQ